MACFSDEIAIEIWIARWRGEGVQSLVLRFKESPFRFYEIWTEEKNPGTRLLAWDRFKREHPNMVSLVDPSPHVPKRKVIAVLPQIGGQLDMFR